MECAARLTAGKACTSATSIEWSIGSSSPSRTVAEPPSRGDHLRWCSWRAASTSAAISSRSVAGSNSTGTSSIAETSSSGRNGSTATSRTARATARARSRAASASPRATAGGIDLVVGRPCAHWRWASRSSTPTSAARSTRTSMGSSPGDRDSNSSRSASTAVSDAATTRTDSRRATASPAMAVIVVDFPVPGAPVTTVIGAVRESATAVRWRGRQLDRRLHQRRPDRARLPRGVVATPVQRIEGRRTQVSCDLGPRPKRARHVDLPALVHRVHREPHHDGDVVPLPEDDSGGASAGIIAVAGNPAAVGGAIAYAGEAVRGDGGGWERWWPSTPRGHRRRPRWSARDASARPGPR